MNLNDIRRTAVAIALDAGAGLMPYFDQPHEETTKHHYNDIVTEGDKASEAIIVPALRDAFPDHHIVSEEGGGTTESGGAEYFWYIDPIDGTTNFANNIPFFCVSIGLADRAFNPLVGVVYNPVSGEMFSAAKGHGAYLGEKRLHVTQTNDLNRSVLCTGFPYRRVDNPDNNLRHWENFLLRSRDVRRFGAAALEICFVAAGRFDGFWEGSLNPWDCVAGVLCVREAGGMVTDYSGKDSPLNPRQVVASNGRIHAQMLEIIANGQ